MSLSAVTNTLITSANHFAINQKNIGGVELRILGPIVASTIQVIVRLEAKTILQETIKDLGAKLPEGLAGILLTTPEGIIFQSSLVPRRATEPLIAPDIWRANLQTFSQTLQTAGVTVTIKENPETGEQKIRTVIGLAPGYEANADVQTLAEFRQNFSEDFDIQLGQILAVHPHRGIYTEPATIVSVKDQQINLYKLLDVARRSTQSRLTIESLTSGTISNYEILENLLPASPVLFIPPENLPVINYQDLVAALNTAVNPSVVINSWYQDGNLFGLPELLALKGIPQNPAHHPEGDAFTHTGLVIDAAREIIRKNPERYGQKNTAILLLGALCHDLGKATHTQYEDGNWKSKGHDTAGEMPARALLQRIGVPADISEAVIAIVINHMKPSSIFRQTQSPTQPISDRSYAKAVRKIIRRVDSCPITLFLDACEADIRGRHSEQAKLPIQNWRVAFERHLQALIL